jgi:hypothetical protein
MSEAGAGGTITFWAGAYANRSRQFDEVMICALAGLAWSGRALGRGVGTGWSDVHPGRLIHPLTIREIVW